MNEALAAAFDNGSLLLAIVVLIALEGLGLYWLEQRGRSPLRLREVLGNLVSGAALMLAVRAALLDQSWTVVAAWLLCALLAHVTDLLVRWRRSV
ncbi:MAG: hypothetical protein ACKODA_11630 [Nevskiaceae bacterium]